MVVRVAPCLQVNVKGIRKAKQKSRHASPCDPNDRSPENGLPAARDWQDAGEFRTGQDAALHAVLA